MAWKQVGQGQQLSSNDRVLVEAAAIVDKEFAKKYGGAVRVGAASDYTWTLDINNYPIAPKPGDDLFIDVSGEVNDVLASYPSAWQIAVVAAVVDASGNLLGVLSPDYNTNSLGDFQVIKSRTPHPPSVPFGTTIAIRSLTGLPMHLLPGKMPNYGITIRVRVYANHDDGPDWNWVVW